MVILYFLSLSILAAPLFGFVALVVRRRRLEDRQAPDDGVRRIRDIFMSGLLLLRRHPIILLLPVIALLIEFGAMVPALLNPPADLNTQRGSSTFFPLLDGLIQSFGKLNTAMLKPFAFSLTAGIWLLGVGYFFLRKSAPHSESQEAIRRRRAIGFATEAGAVFFLALYALSEHLFPTGLPGARLLHVWQLASIPVVASVNAVLLTLIVSAARDKKIAPVDAVFGLRIIFLPLLFFSLAKYLISIAGFLYLLVPGVPGPNSFLTDFGPYLFISFIFLISAMVNVLFAAFSFVPVIIAARQKSLVDAFNECISFWARRTKICLLFVLASVVLLVLPVGLESAIRGIPSFANIKFFAIRFMIDSWEIFVGVLIMTSMSIFYLQFADEGWKEPVRESD